MNIASLSSNIVQIQKEELGKIVIEEVEEDMEEILKHFQYMLNEQLLEKMYKEKAEDIMKCIPMRMEQFYEKFDKRMYGNSNFQIL